MNISNEERKVFSEIQKRLFYMIPEKWEAIYLYASIIEEPFKKAQGEMFFYYLPKGILKKNYVNVYEIPGLFNIDEETYNDLINKLFLDIKKLRDIAMEKHPILWTSITITIESFQFKIEYNYDDVDMNSEFTPYERHVIWRYKNLKLDFDTLSKKERDIVKRYVNSDFCEKINKDVYSEGIYTHITHNIIDYAKTISLESALAMQKVEEKEVMSYKERLELLKKKNRKLKADMQELDNTNNQILFGIKNDKKNEEDDIDFENEIITTDKMNKKGKSDTSYEDEEVDWDNELLTTEKMVQRKKINKDKK